VKKKIPKNIRIAVASVSTVLVIISVILLIILKPNETITYSNEIFLISILTMITPTAVLDYLNQAWVENIEDQMPVLVKGLSESQETGVTLTRGLENVVQNKMVRGPLASEVKKLTVQMSWGLSFEEALERFKERISSPVVNRFCALVLEASLSGGRIRKVFTATSQFMEEMREVDRETASQMRPYTIIVYAAFFVFVFIAIVLVQSFFAPLEGLTPILSSATIVGVREYKDFFYRTMIIAGVMGGLMAGKLANRRVASGLKHSIALAVIGYIVFFLAIPPNWTVK